MRARSMTPFFFALGFYGLAALSIGGCAAWDRFTTVAGPIAVAAMGAIESAGCQLHTAEGIPEGDARAGAIHDAGAAVDALMHARTPEEVDALAVAARAFTAAIEEVTGGIPVAAAPLPSSVLPYVVRDGGGGS